MEVICGLIPEKEISVKIDAHKSIRYHFYIGEHNLGFILGIENHSNCGVFDLHNLSTVTGKSDIILQFMMVLCKSLSRSILTYNTNENQIDLKRALKKNGFHTVGKTFRNKSSSHDIEFHILDVYNG